MITNETIHSLASSRNHTGNDAIDNVGNYIKEWWRVIHPMDESWAIAHLKRERDDYKIQRDTLIDDIAVLRANNERLERENEKQLELLKDFRKLIDYKLSLHQGSLMYREYRSKLDQLGVK